MISLTPIQKESQKQANYEFSTLNQNNYFKVSKGKTIYEYYCNKCFWMKFDQWICLEMRIQVCPLIELCPKTFIAVVI